MKKDENLTGGAARICCLLELLEQEGRVSERELSSRMGVSGTSAAQYLRAMRASGVVSLGRARGVGTQQGRSVRLSNTWSFCTVWIGKTSLRVSTYCPATGERKQRTLPLCDAIPEKEAVEAALRGLPELRADAEQGYAFEILEDGAPLSEHVSALSAWPMEQREVLTTAALLRRYPEESVLYVRFGERPALRMIVGGVALPSLRPEADLLSHWPTDAQTRMAMLARAIGGVMGLIAPDVIVIEADGACAESVAMALREKLHAEGVILLPPMVLEAGGALAEREAHARLRQRLALQILASAKET